MSATLNISEIRIDGKTQSRVEMNNDVIAEYATAIQDGAEFPPITVFFDGSSYWLADGYHRFHAHKQAGKEYIKAIVTQGTQRDAVLYSVGANASHGLRRTNADKRKAVMTLLEDVEWVKWPQTRIAEVCGVSREFVSRVNSELSASCDRSQDKPTVRTVERNGKTYQQNTANIGKKKEPVVKNPQPEEQHQSEAPAIDEEKEKLKEALAQAQELNSELAMDLEAAEINTSENKESETLVLIKQRDVERSQKEQYMNKCNELIKQNRLLTNALNRKEKEIEKLKAFIAENRIGEIDAAL